MNHGGPYRTRRQRHVGRRSCLEWSAASTPGMAPSPAPRRVIVETRGDDDGVGVRLAPNTGDNPVGVSWRVRPPVRAPSWSPDPEWRSLAFGDAG